MTSLSILIHHLPGAPSEAFEGTLVSVLESLPDAAEILVLDAVGYADPWNIRDEGVRFISLPPGTSAVTGMNVGIRHALGEIVHPLAPGARVRNGWTDDLVQHFADPCVGCVVPVFTDPLWLRIASLGLLLRPEGRIQPIRRYRQFGRDHLVTAPITAGAFFRRQLLESFDFFDTSFSLQNAYIDFALMLALHKFRTVLETDCCIAFMGNCQESTISFAEGCQQERLYRRWAGRLREASGWRHASFLLAEFWKHFPAPRGFSHLAGRLGTMFTTEDRKEHLEKCEAIRAAVDMHAVRETAMNEVIQAVRPAA